MTRKTRITLTALVDSAPANAATLTLLADKVKSLAKSAEDRATRRKLNKAQYALGFAATSLLALTVADPTETPAPTQAPTRKSTPVTPLVKPSKTASKPKDDAPEGEVKLTRKERRRLNKLAWRKEQAEREKLRKAGKLERTEGETLSRAERKAARKAERKAATEARRAETANTVTCDHCGCMVDMDTLTVDETNAIIRGEACLIDGCMTHAVPAQYRTLLANRMLAEMEEVDEEADTDTDADELALDEQDDDLAL